MTPGRWSGTWWRGRGCRCRLAIPFPPEDWGEEPPVPSPPRGEGGSDVVPPRVRRSERLQSIKHRIVEIAGRTEFTSNLHDPEPEPKPSVPNGRTGFVFPVEGRLWL